MSNEILKPCPFCGSEARMLGTEHQWFNPACSNPDCGCEWTDSYTTEAEAIEAWNTRPVETCILEGSYSMGGWLDEREPIWTFDFSCGHSFTSLDNEPPAHCPECGKKVVML